METLIQQLAEDLVERWKLEEIREKYSDKKFPFSIEALFNEIKKRFSEEALLDSEMTNKHYGDYLIKDNNCYQVFSLDRGAHCYEKSFQEIIGASKYKIKLMLNGVASSCSQ